MNKLLLKTSIALASLAIAGTAAAQNVAWSVSVGSGGYGGYGGYGGVAVGIPAPVVIAPAPVYLPPVVVRPAPVYAPVYAGPAYPAPVVIATPRFYPPVYAPAAVVYRGGPYGYPVAAHRGHHGHRHYGQYGWDQGHRR